MVIKEHLFTFPVNRRSTDCRISWTKLFSLFPFVRCCHWSEESGMAAIKRKCLQKFCLY
jgi:hypothetical protein